MFKAKIVAVFIVMLSLLMTAASCRNANSKANNTADETPASTITASGDETAANQSASPSAAVTAFEFENKTYSDGVISIKIPQIKNYSDSVLQEKLNKMISDSAKRDVDSLKGDTTLDDYQINGIVTYNSLDLISIYFEGYSSYESAAHPSQFLYAITIDVNKLQAVRLKDLVKIDESFYKLLITGKINSMGYDMTDEYRSEIQDYLKEFGAEYWVPELINADSSGYITVSYLTKDALAVSVSVSHVMGDHVEILMPYKDLKGFKTNNPIWDAIN